MKRTAGAQPMINLRNMTRSEYTSDHGTELLGSDHLVSLEQKVNEVSCPSGTNL